MYLMSMSCIAQATAGQEESSEVTERTAYTAQATASQQESSEAIQLTA